MPENRDFYTAASHDAPVALSVSPATKARAQRHLERAQDQIKLRNVNSAIRELQDAIQIDPSESQYHALLAKIHLDRGMEGAANVSLRQAFKLNPEDPTALECQKRLKQKAAIAQRQQSGGFLGGLFGKNK